MANTYTNINDAKVMSDCVGALKLGLTPLDVFSMSVGSDPSEKNETVTVPLVTAMSGATNATNYASGDTTVVGKVVNLTTNFSRSWHITAKQASKNSTDIFEKAAVEATYSVAYLVQLSALNLITRASYGTSTEAIIASSSFDSDAVQDIRNTCVNTLKWRANSSMSLVLDGAYYTNLAKDPAQRDMSASGADTNASGKVDRNSGFRIIENGVIASSTPYGATEYLRGFAALPQAMALAVRPPAILGNSAFEVNEIAVDPDSGISLNYRRWIDPVTNALWGCVETLFGGAAVDGNALYRIVSQESS